MLLPDWLNAVLSCCDDLTDWLNVVLSIFGAGLPDWLKVVFELLALGVEGLPD